MIATCSGDHIKDGLFTVVDPRGAKGSPQAFLKIKFTDVLISSYQTGGGGSEAPTDQFSLNFAKIEIAVRNDQGVWTSAESCDFPRGEVG